MKLKLALNNPTYNLHDRLALVALGDCLRSLPVQLYAQAPVTTDVSELATETAIVLPEDAKAALIVRAYARAGTTGALGELTVSAPNVTPVTAHIAIAPNGDLVLLAADGYTSVDVVYLPLKGYSRDLGPLPVASNALTLPAGYTFIGIASAVSVAGTLTGNLKVLAPGASVATGQCALSANKASVNFASADAVTSADLVMLVAPTIDLNTALEASVDF